MGGEALGIVKIICPSTVEGQGQEAEVGAGFLYFKRKGEIAEWTKNRKERCEAGSALP